MIIKPFAALRPQEKYVKECAALPYDVMSSDEAREEVKGKRYSFLHIDKAEIDLDKSISTKIVKSALSCATSLKFDKKFQGEYYEKILKK